MGGIFSVPLVGLPLDAASAGEVRVTLFLDMSSRVACISHVVPATPRCAHALNSVLAKVRAATIGRGGARSAFETAMQKSSPGELGGLMHRLEFSEPAGAPAIFIGSTALFAGSPEAVGGGKTYDDISPGAAVAVWTLSNADSTRLLRAIGRLWLRCQAGGTAAEVSEDEDDALGSDYEAHLEAELRKQGNMWSKPIDAVEAAKASIRAV